VEWSWGVELGWMVCLAEGGVLKRRGGSFRWECLINLKWVTLIKG